MKNEDVLKIGEGINGALFDSPDRIFRYSLWRIWNPGGKLLLFIGLNPSTANDIKDDPTIRRLVGFAKAWGFGGLLAGNLFSLVTAYPDVLWRHPSSKQPDDFNDRAILRMEQMCSKVLVAWGDQGRHAGSRPEEVLRLLGDPVYCFKLTAAGEPYHPLYLPLNSQTIPYARGIAKAFAKMHIPDGER